MTLRELVEKHPEYLDRELVVLHEDGGYSYFEPYEAFDLEEKCEVLVFDGS